MKARRGEIERLIAAPPDGLRLFLFHGPDTAGSAALAARFATAMGPDSERVELAPPVLKSDPARLADEAAALPLFGGKRHILVPGGGDELVEAVSLLLDAPVEGNPAVIVAGALRKGSKLLALAEISPRALAAASYVPEGRDAQNLALELARAGGLSMSSDLARRIADAGNGDRALIAAEVEKFALYLDASPGDAKRLDDEAFLALAAGDESADGGEVVDAVLDGDAATLARWCASVDLAAAGIPALRALGRRLALLARLRGEVDRGQDIDAVMASGAKSLFYRDKPAVTRQLGSWNSIRIGAAMAHVLEAEEDLKAVASLGTAAVEKRLFALARAGARQAR